MLDSGQVKVDAALSNLSRSFKNNAFVAERICKILTVAKDSGKFFTYGKQAFKLINTYRIDGTESNRAHLVLGIDTYSCDQHALSDVVTDKVRRNADPALNPDFDTTEMLSDLLLLRLEYDVATELATTARYANSNYTTLSGTSQWSDYSNSNPLTNIKSAKAVIRALIGREPNAIVLAGDVAETLSLHPDIKDLRKYTDPNLLTSAGLPPKILGLEVIEAKATYNKAYENLTESMSYLWGKNAYVMYMPERVGLKSLAPWIIIRENGFRKTKRWREEKVEGDMIEVSDSYDIKEVADECAYLIVNAIA